jgi:hypothetical protein
MSVSGEAKVIARSQGGALRKKIYYPLISVFVNKTTT